MTRKAAQYPSGFKHCVICDKMLPATLEYFLRNNKSGGLLSRCIQCRRLLCKAYNASASGKEKRAVYQKNNQEKTRAYRQTYNANHPEMRSVSSAAWRAGNAKRYLAQKEVFKAICRGELNRHPCQVCGREKSEGHHPDYDRPLDVVWLCRTHHAEVHALANNIAAIRARKDA